MLKRIRNERGLLLPELVASLPLGVIVLTVMTLTVVNFLLAYSDLRDYVKMQDELFQTIETIRYGYTQRGINTNGAALCGMLTANQAQLNDAGNSLTLKVDGDPAFPIESRFWITGDGMLKLRGGYGSQLFSQSGSNSNDISLFPRSNRRLDGELKYRILNPGTAFNIVEADTDVNLGTSNVRLLGIDIKAQVRFRERGDGQSEEDDRRMNTRQIRYQTKIYVPNTPSEA